MTAEALCAALAKLTQWLAVTGGEDDPSAPVSGDTERVKALARMALARTKG